MCPPRPMGNTPSLSARQTTPKVCTLHVTDAPPSKKQYIPCGPMSSAKVGHTPVKVAKRTRVILPLQVKPPLPAGALVLFQPADHSLLGDNPIIQEVQSDRSLAVLADNLETTDQELGEGSPRRRLSCSKITSSTLGHVVSARGISIPPEYTSVIKEWPIPHNIKTLRAFLGKCEYYRRFIADYATISAPLVQYTKQD